MAGVNTEVVEVVVPSSAQVGASVSVQVKIKNTTDEALTIMAGGALEYGVTPWPAVNFTDESAEVAAGETQSFYGSFTMPESDVEVHGYSYYYDEDEAVWYFDDGETNGVTAVAAPAGIDINSIMNMMILLVVVVMMMKTMGKVTK